MVVDLSRMIARPIDQALRSDRWVLFAELDALLEIDRRSWRAAAGLAARFTVSKCL